MSYSNPMNAMNPSNPTNSSNPMNPTNPTNPTNQINPNPSSQLLSNLSKTLEIIDTCFNLKEAYLKQKYPHSSQDEIADMVYQGILSRKNNQWKLQKTSLRP